MSFEQNQNPTYQVATTNTVIGQYKVVTIDNSGIASIPTHFTSQVLSGISLRSASSGPIPIQTYGILDAALFNLGDGYACAVGSDSSGNPIRVTDSSCVSATNYIGYCDGYGTITVAPRRAENFNVADYGAVGDGVIDDTFSIQSAINAAANAGGGTVYFPLGVTSKITSGLTIGGHRVSIEGNNATLDFQATDGYAIDAAPIASVYPNACSISKLGIILSGNGPTTGICWRFTHSEARQVSIVLNHDNQTGIEVAGDINGTGPYYNHFYACDVQGSTNLTQIGWNFTHPAGNTSAFPNANQFFGGRVGEIGLAWHIEGGRNVLFAPVIEGIVANGTAFDINHTSVSGGAGAIGVYNAYVEQSNQTGTTIFNVGSNATGTIIVQPYLTGISPGTSFSDAGIETTIIAQENIQFDAKGLIIQQEDATKPTKINGATPAILLHETGNDYETAIANEGGSDAGNYAFSVRDNITAGRLVASFGTVTSQLRATSMALGIGSYSGLGLYVGSSSPETSISAPVGSVYLANSGGTGTALWVKESGAGNTGWVRAVTSATLSAAQDGYALTWDNTDGYWKAEPANSIPSQITVINASNTRTETSNYTIDSSGPDFIVYVDTSGGPVTITLPVPTQGRIITLKDKKNTFDGYNMTIARHSTELLDGYGGSLVVFQKGAEIVINSDGTDYYTNYNTLGQWWQNSAISYWSGWTAGSAIVGFVGFTPSTGNTSSGNVQPTSTSLLTSTRRMQFNATSDGAKLGLNDNSLLSVWRGNAAGLGGFRMSFRLGFEQFATSTTTMTLDCFAGIVSNNGPNAKTNYTTQTTYHTIGFGFHGVFASAVSGNWQFITSDASSPPHIIDCGSNFAINTTSLLEMEIWAPPNASLVYFKITDLSTGAILSGSNSTILPTNTQFMSTWCATGVTSAATITGSNKFSVARYMIETPY